ncbi:MAG: amino acid adenylation domain-containing protein, partial [Clostridia bacterium]|nr:amino acid adenylation domain-containing protein [Clostridia bacterium]
DSSNAGDRLAYVVYTSGSTGEPKGVEITQRSLLNLASEMETVYGQGAILSVCNVGFDAFMLESIAALLNGKTIVLPDERELESPERLAALVNGYAVGFLSVTPSRLSAFLQNDAFRGVMWRMESIICGGEHFPPELLKKLKMCTAARIYNQYGPSETTVAVSMKDLSHADRITAGKPMGNCKLYVLDQWMNPLPIGGNGRLFVGGKCVGRGYRNRPDLTEKVFRNNPFVSDDRLYDTGDLAYWTPDGEIVLTGRADRQVKLRGLRIELQEIASCIESYPGIDAAYARICEFGGQQVIGAYYSAGCDLNEMELLSHVATYLPEYMIPTFVMRVSGFAITANGKIDEKKLPMPQKTADTACTDISATAERITEIFREVLSQEDIYANSDYFLCGGNSLNALTCIIKIEEAFSQKIRISDLYACRTANRLAELIDSSSPSYHKKQASGPSVPASYLMKKAPACAEYPLSPMQEGIYVQSMLDPNGLSYNMPGAFLLETAPDRLRLRGAFERLIAEDAIFRTSFSFGENGICARVSEKVEFVLEELSADTFEDACKAFLRPFDLTRAPLLRAALWTSGEGASYLLIDSHHIIGDGMSTPIVLQRLDRAYSGKDLFVEWDYYDYLHTAAQENGDEKKRSLDYWTSHLQDLPEPLVIPTDKVPPKTFDYKGDDLALTLTEEQSRICEQFCRENGYSEYVLFLAAWGLLLSAASGNKDMIIGTPVAGRKYFGSTDVCGPFINTLPLRLTPSRELTVTQWLKRVQNEVSQMLDHQDVSLEEIITALDLPRGGQNALYRVMLTQSPVDESGFMLDGKKMVFRGIPTGSVKMDMILELAKKDACYVLRFSYAASLFERQTVAFYGRCIVQIVKELTQNGDRAVSELALLCAADKETYIDIPNFSATPFVNRPVHQILKSRSAMDGDATAVIYHGEEISFARLERRAMAIAHFLEEHGVRPGQCVGLCLRRTPDMIAAMYGILKAGCAYMFMLESFPLSRKTYMLEISNAAILLCDTASDPLLQEKLPCETYPLPVGACDSYDDRLVSDDDLVNVLFTSGSTGRPKGVMLSHRSVSNLCAQMKTLLDPIPGRVLCSTNAVFDCFVVETMIALALGRTVVLADEEEMMLPWKLAQLVETYRTGIFEMTPSRLQMCLGNEAFCHAAKHIRIVLLGGEVVTETLRDKFYAHSDGMLMNMYGPTEATVFTTMAHLKTGEHITIGAPLQNTRVYVLDEDRKPVLPTAYGEIYIAGECLSCGYISRPELTEQSFFDDIYFPGQKMYRSGDLARLRMDGRYDYLGRKDAQVKLNGQRVELTEITGAIDHVDGIVQSAIVPVKKEDGSMTLHVFYTTDMDVTSERIIAEISRVLPEYMVPSVYTVLKHMPVTATNKIDMQTLRAMATDQKTVNPEEHTASALAQTEVPCAPAEAAHTVADPLGTEAAVEDASIASAPCHRETDSVPAAEDTAEAAEETSVRPVRSGVVLNTEYILSVWNSVLPMPAKDPTESFFKQGGTSMSALNVLSRFYNDGFEMTLTDFYTNPTAEMQVSLLGRSRAVMAVTDNASETDTETTQTAEEEHACSILVTGATGFLGVHIVKELLDGGAKKVACLVRDGSRERLDSILTYYFGDEDAARLSARIEIVCGNITQKMLGLSSDDYRRLVGSIKEIYHCAADVRHYAADEAAFLSTNVDGTENMLTLARRADAQFYHMSTCSVSGDNLRKGNVEAIFTERDYDIGQIWERNIYVKSKFLAEGLVFEAIKEGLRAKIFRVGRLVGRASDGKFQRNPETNAFYLFIKGILSVGAIPCDAAQINIDLMPVDLCAMEIVALAHSSGTVYHMENAIPATLGEILNTVDDGGILAVSREAFIEMFRKNCRSMDNDLLVMVMNNWRIMELRKPKIVVTNDMTIAALKEAGFVYPDVSIKTILREFEKGE